MGGAVIKRVHTNKWVKGPNTRVRETVSLRFAAALRMLIWGICLSHSIISLQLVKIEVLEPPGRIFRNALEKYPFIFVKLRLGSGQIFKPISVVIHFGGSRTRQTWVFGFFTTFPHFCGGSRPAKMDPPDFGF